MTWEEKLNAVRDHAIELARNGGDYQEVSNGIFSPGQIAFKLFPTREDRERFIETPQFVYIRKILGILLEKQYGPRKPDS